jgi:hypothetical protein
MYCGVRLRSGMAETLTDICFTNGGPFLHKSFRWAIGYVTVRWDHLERSTGPTLRIITAPRSHALETRQGTKHSSYMMVGVLDGRVG